MHDEYHQRASFALSQVEADPFCQQVLKARIKNQCLHAGVVHGDVRTFSPGPSGVANVARGTIGGFPCQVRCLVMSCLLTFFG